MTAEVHPAEFIQLRLQMVYFALPVAQLFLQGVDQRFLFGQALFQQENVVRRDVVHTSCIFRRAWTQHATSVCASPSRLALNSRS
ncbi:hypothetical protein HmCmsJML119_02606 [Escherichia coli]|nr:hypothetical protein HmCmsJML119_02606 [Escherichia coli]